MQKRGIAIAAILVVLAGITVFACFGKGDGAPPAPPSSAAAAPAGADPAVGGQHLEAVVAAPAAPTDDRERTEAGRSDTGVRGIVLDARTGQPLAGVEVRALHDEPTLEPLLNRFRGLFQGGMFTDTHRPAHVLGTTVSGADGRFEIKGLPAGRVFLDGRSDGWFVRTPGTARLASGEFQDGVELRASPGGRVRGIVLGADGGPVAGAHVSLRPGLNAFLGQLTERKYRWLDTVTDQDGRFDIPGVPTGNGYAAAAAAPTIALEEQYGIEVREGQVTDLVLRGHPGATVAGRVLDAGGAPVAKANVAMVYLDISRVLFSADGRSEPITTDADGRFALRPVASGRVAFVAAADGLAPSNIVDLAVVDGGVYDDLELRLGDGLAVAGKVVDDQNRPVAGAKVELRPFERPQDPQFLKMMLKIRRVEVETDAAGAFVAKGLTGEQLIVQASKPGYTTAIRFGVKLDEKDLVVQVQRGVTIRGVVQLADGKPLPRFRVDAGSRPPRPATAPATAPGTARATTPGDATGPEAGKANAAAARDDRADALSGPTWADDQGGDRSGLPMRFGRGGMRSGTVQLPEGQTMEGRGMNIDGNWREFAAADGHFELRGVPPGHVTVRVRADGYLDPKNQELDLAAGQASDLLTFAIEPGVAASGVVLDAATNKPVSDAQVTAYRQREGGQGRGGVFGGEIDGEDFDFLGLSASAGRRSAITDSQGRFRIESLADGKYRFTARHPDKAKASAKEVEVTAARPPTGIEIRLDAGGGIEGTATGLGMRPLPDAVIAAFSLQTGTLRSSTTDKAGAFRIDGLPPGQYFVFKSRMDERADNIPLELLSNMRLKSATVKQGRFTRVDVHDETEDGVRVHGCVRESGRPVARALVTLLGSDREGILGMGVRANAAGMDGRYELAGIKPGSYVVQVSRFQGRPVQTSFELEVPADQRDLLFDIELPTSEVAGRVLDSHGDPVPGMQVSLGSDHSGLAGAGGLVGMIAQGGLGQGRTDENGEFRLRSVAPGTYRLRAGNRLGGGGRRGGGGGASAATRYGQGSIEGITVDGMTNVEGLVVTVPFAGSITGIVVDGSAAPVRGAEIHYAETSGKRDRGDRNPLADLFGMQARPIVSGADGRFEINGLDPGVYDLRVDTEALEAGRAQDVRVVENGTAEVTLHIVRGATLKVRAVNIDKQQIPLAYVSLLDGNGKKIVNKISTLSVMRRFMANRDEVADTGWYEFGSVPPDTYTLVVSEPGKPELRITRAIADGETVAWEIDVAAELRSRDAGKK